MVCKVTKKYGIANSFTFFFVILHTRRITHDDYESLSDTTIMPDDTDGRRTRGTAVGTAAGRDADGRRHGDR